ncbi:hypothetical protein [Streptomyces beigongshangae]|uniref:hypothetical protein n=1 Tax=Streptomyces beigongshangae TaxID=2841597 RepID=UPI0021A680D0|nr:hypothetical protein [Streptomyces sp. REN17]
MPASILGEVGDLPGSAVTRGPFTRPDHLDHPSRGSAHVTQVLGDSGGVSYVCTACGHSWS